MNVDEILEAQDNGNEAVFFFVKKNIYQKMIRTEFMYRLPALVVNVAVQMRM